MQKVEGSSPFIRLLERPAPAGLSCCRGRNWWCVVATAPAVIELPIERAVRIQHAAWTPSAASGDRPATYPGRVNKVFVSSVMLEFEAERAAARRAVESLSLRAVMAETAPASPDASKHALLDLVDAADAVVMILGARYGYIAEHGLSPTEEEFNHARQVGKPVFVFVQNGVRCEPEQQEFVRRVQGGWGECAFTAFFDTPEALGFAVVQALSAHRDTQRGDALPAVRVRARQLAVGDDRRSSGTPGTSVRVAFAPAGADTLIDALVLGDGTLADPAAGVIRAHGLVPQSSGIEARVSSQAVRLSAKAPHEFHTTTVTLAADGAVLVEADARAEGAMGGMVISYPRVETSSPQPRRSRRTSGACCQQATECARSPSPSVSRTPTAIRSSSAARPAARYRCHRSPARSSHPTRHWCCAALTWASPR
jgi:Domain of unknown function (DUF4062)